MWDILDLAFILVCSIFFQENCILTYKKKNNNNNKTAYCILFQPITDSEAFSVGATSEIGLKHNKIF